MQVVVDQACRAPDLYVVALALSGRVGTFLPPRDQKLKPPVMSTPAKPSRA
jgi:hypothetical protein